MMQPLIFSSSMNILQAQRSDIETVLDILEEAAQWLTAKGIDQWQPGVFYNTRRASISERVEQGVVYLLMHEKQAIGTITLRLINDWDAYLWQSITDVPAEDAIYVHNLAARRMYAGAGYSMLQWAEKRIAATHPYVRLDCMGDNSALRAYYERAGYRLRGIVSFKQWKAALYEKWVSVE